MNNEIKRWGEKFIVLLVVLLLIFPFDLPAKKKGARLKVHKKDGEIIIGELLQVKEKSLLLMTNSETGATVDINEVSRIRIVKKSKILQGIGWGALIGVGSIALGYFLLNEYGFDDMTRLESALFIGVICGGIPGGITGAIVGGIAGTDKKIQVEGKSQFKIDSILKKLKKKARIK